MTFQERITHLIESGFQAIYITTGERSRCEDELSKVAEKIRMEFITWDSVNGFSENGECKDPLEALQSMTESENAWSRRNILFVMRNMHGYLSGEGAIRQSFQNLYYGRMFSNQEAKRPIIILAGSQEIHPEIQQCITMAEFSLPSETELTKVFTDVADSIEIDPNRPGAVATDDDELKARAIQAMRGLTTIEAENILCYSLRVNRGYKQSLIDTIEDQKALTIEKSEILTYVPKDRILTMDQIGGYDELKDFMAQRRLAYSRKARELKMDMPRGIVLLGPPGTGKSVVGKVIARELGQPLVILNISAVFGSLVGESERRIRTALATIDALDGAVVLVDEAEKALGGAVESVGDSGVSRRVFGVLLTWLTEKTSRTFVVMTMNRTLGIPPEFLRRGRFDEIFYTDLPDVVERDEILKIHCKKRNIDPMVYKPEDWLLLVERTGRCVGSELEQMVCDARFASFASRQEGVPTIEELIKAIPLAPIADAEKENIDNIRKMCEDRARPVSRQRADKKDKKSRTLVV